MIVGHGTSNEIAKAVNLVVESKSPEIFLSNVYSIYMFKALGKNRGKL